MYEEDNEPVHLWFGLTYANYLVLHRSLMQSMPVEWQRRMVRCLAEFEDAFRHIERAEQYEVRVRGADGRYRPDPVPHYNRGRTHVEPRPEIEGSVPPSSLQGED
jgi:hypothetical protein